MQEKRVFDAGSIVVTTHRLVWGETTYHLGDVRFTQVDVDRPTGCAIMAAIFTIGPLWALFKGQFIMLLPILLIGGALYLAWPRMSSASLLLFGPEDVVRLKLKDIPLVNRLAAEVNRAIELRRGEEQNALRSELHDLPDA